MAEAHPCVTPTEVPAPEPAPLEGEFAPSPAAVDGSPAAHATDPDRAVVRRRARTHSAFVEQRDAEVLITEYANLDNTYLKSIGNQDKTYCWKVLVGGLPQTINLELRVQKTVAMSSQVSVIANGERIFPEFGAAATATMNEDFSHKWNFRGIPEGFREKLKFEVKPYHFEDTWFPATLTTRRQDGTYEVLAIMPALYGVTQEVVLPGITLEKLRNRVTKEPVKLQTRQLVLEVPQSAPHKATLRVLSQGSETEWKDATRFLGRWTPVGMVGAHLDAGPDRSLTPAAASPTVQLEVSRNALGQDTLSTNVGHSALTHFMSGEVCSVSSECSLSLNKSWKIQVGPYAEHTINIESKSNMNIIHLVVDGTTMVEAAASDIGGDDENWTCDFRLVGDRFLEFKMDNAYTIVEKTQKKLENAVLTEYEKSAFPDFVSLPIRVTHDCRITMPKLANIADATLTIDGRDFRTLRPKTTHPLETCVSGPAELFKFQYGIVPPRGVSSNTVTTGVEQSLAWSVEGLAKVHEQLPSVEQVKTGAGIAARHTMDTITAMQDGLGNFMTNIGGVWGQPTTPQTMEERENMHPGLAESAVSPVL